MSRCTHPESPLLIPGWPVSRLTALARPVNLTAIHTIAPFPSTTLHSHPALSTQVHTSLSRLLAEAIHGHHDDADGILQHLTSESKDKVREYAEAFLAGVSSPAEGAG